MSENYHNDALAENEGVGVGSRYSSKKFKKTDILIFIACLLFAFVFWCYALFVDDPVIERQVALYAVLEGGSADEYVVLSEVTVSVYGAESVMNSFGELTVYVDRDAFSATGESVTVEIAYPDGARGELGEVGATLYSYDENTDK